MFLTRLPAVEQATATAALPHCGFRQMLATKVKKKLKINKVD
jgi:hypothetical protein